MTDSRFKFSLKYLFIVFLIVVAFWTWLAVIKNFKQNRSELTIQLAEIFEEIALPFRIAKLATMPREPNLLMPLVNVPLEDIDDTWHEPRSGGRLHEGIDIFAEEGTPVFSTTSGYVTEVGVGELGGNYVSTVGPGGVRYYYAHFSATAKGLSRGDEITPDTVLGFVGNTGNAITTPPHLHFGVYTRDGAENPYPLLIER